MDSYADGRDVSRYALVSRRLFARFEGGSACVRMAGGALVPTMAQLEPVAGCAAALFHIIWLF